MIDELKTIGIEKGKPFKPDTATQKTLNDAAREAHAWLDLKYETVFMPPFNEGTHWALPALPGVAEGMMTNFAISDAYPVDGRGVAYSMAYFSAKHLGTGQYYLMTIVDKDAQPFDGRSNYRLNVPANPPVRLYWSATVYDRATHALIRDMRWSSRSSNTPGLQKNADGSVDIYFGPKAPTGKESNWVPTKSGGLFEVLFRLYGPEKPLFDKTWKLPIRRRCSRGFAPSAWAAAGMGASIGHRASGRRTKKGPSPDRARGREAHSIASEIVFCAQRSLTTFSCTPTKGEHRMIAGPTRILPLACSRAVAVARAPMTAAAGSLAISTPVMDQVWIFWPGTATSASAIHP
jgi:Protein of unknown function (DUF1214)